MKNKTTFESKVIRSIPILGAVLILSIIGWVIFWIITVIDLERFAYIENQPCDHEFVIRSQIPYLIVVDHYRYNTGPITQHYQCKICEKCGAVYIVNKQLWKPSEIYSLENQHGPFHDPDTTMYWSDAVDDSIMWINVKAN